MTPHLTWRDALLALAIVLVWGTNFVVIRLGLNALPPLFYATLRFVFVIVPAILFLPRPKVRLSNLALLLFFRNDIEIVRRQFIRANPQAPCAKRS